jgi:hypothetical protein
MISQNNINIGSFCEINQIILLSPVMSRQNVWHHPKERNIVENITMIFIQKHQ